VEILNQHNIAAPVIDLSYQDSPPIRRNCQAGPAPSLLVKLADGPNRSRGSFAKIRNTEPPWKLLCHFASRLATKEGFQRVLCLIIGGFNAATVGWRHSHAPQ
jgi:hypothetical protein